MTPEHLATHSVAHRPKHHGTPSTHYTYTTFSTSSSYSYYPDSSRLRTTGNCTYTLHHFFVLLQALFLHLLLLLLLMAALSPSIKHCCNVHRHICGLLEHFFYLQLLFAYFNTSAEGSNFLQDSHSLSMCEKKEVFLRAFDALAAVGEKRKRFIGRCAALRRPN